MRVAIVEGMGSFGGEFGGVACRPSVCLSVTNGDILSSLCESDTLFANYFGEDCLCYSQPDCE